MKANSSYKVLAMRWEDGTWQWSGSRQGPSPRRSTSRVSIASEASSESCRAEPETDPGVDSPPIHGQRLGFFLDHLV